MFLARVTGAVVATQKAETMTGQKLLVVEPVRVDPNDRGRLVSAGRTFIAVDPLGAGIGQMNTWPAWLMQARGQIHSSRSPRSFQ